MSSEKPGVEYALACEDGYVNAGTITRNKRRTWEMRDWCRQKHSHTVVTRTLPAWSPVGQVSQGETNG